MREIVGSLHLYSLKSLNTITNREEEIRRAIIAFRQAANIPDENV